MQNPSEPAQGKKPLRTLTGEQADIIGEVSNISMGSAATALSNIMNKKVTITSPHVEMDRSDSLEKIQQIPSVDVIVSYTSGIRGSNMLIIRQSDAAEIVRAMTSGMLDESEPDFGEMHLSAIGEVMNQMMGSAATALSGFIGRPVNISTPSAFILTDENKEEKLRFLHNDEQLVFVRFLFRVEGAIESDLYMLMTPDFAMELVNGMIARMEPADTPQAPQPDAPAPAGPEKAAPATPADTPPAAAPESAADSRAAGIVRQAQPQTSVSAQVAAAASSGAAAYAPPEPPRTMVHAAAPARTAVRPVVLPDFDESASPMTPDETANFDLIQDVPLELSVEVGRARKRVKEVIDFSVGSIIELDKQAGDPVDIIVNGQLIAHGEVVVIDESFGVRVTEIVGKSKTGGK